MPSSASFVRHLLLTICMSSTTVLGADHTVRFATYNVALNRKTPGQLASELKSGESTHAKNIAEVIQRVRPDILLLNEVDFDEAHASITSLLEQYLAVSQNEQKPIEYAEFFTAAVNTVNRVAWTWMATDKKVIRATRTDMEPFLDNMAWSFYLAIRSNATQRGRFNIFSGKTCQTHSYPRTPTPTNLSSTMPRRKSCDSPPRATGTYPFASDNEEDTFLGVSPDSSGI